MYAKGKLIRRVTNRKILDGLQTVFEIWLVGVFHSGEDVLSGDSHFGIHLQLCKGH